MEKPKVRRVEPKKKVVEATQPGLLDYKPAPLKAEEKQEKESWPPAGYRYDKFNHLVKDD